MTTIKGSRVSNLGYRGNNSRIDKTLKNGKKHYKTSSAPLQRYKNTIGIYQDDCILMVDFFLVNVAEEAAYWKFASKSKVKASIDFENSFLKLTCRSKTKRFEIEVC